MNRNPRENQAAFKGDLDAVKIPDLNYFWNSRLIANTGFQA
jgi:hypothetical protein